MLLARGKIIYFNEAKLAVNYFASIDYACPELNNPADYFMTMMSIESIETEILDEQGNVIGEKSDEEVMVEYEAAIAHMVDSYEASALKVDPTVEYPELVPLTGYDASV